MGLNIGSAGNLVSVCTAALQTLRDNSDAIYDAVWDAVGSHQPPKRKRQRNRRLDDYVGNAGGEAELDQKSEYRRLSCEVLDKNIRCLGERFGSLNQFTFMKLLDVGMFKEYRSKFPEQLFGSLFSSVYGPGFTRPSLRSDLIMVFTRTDFPVGLRALAAMCKVTQLETVVPAFCRLVELALTLPLTVCSAERSFSKLLLIKSKLRSTMGDERLANLALMSLEPEILESLDSETLINRFAEKERRIALRL